MTHQEKWIQILEANQLLRGMFESLTDSMQEETREWLDELKGARGEAKAEGLDKVSEEECEAFGEWINAICREDGMPRLYGELEEETK